MGLLMLAAAKGTIIQVRTEGYDAAEAMEAIGESGSQRILGEGLTK